jgi:PAS domain S-box-containing protein
MIWILASDYIAGLVADFSYIQMFKGAAFVLVTGGLLFFILTRAARAIRTYESQLIASEERFRRVVEHTPGGIFIKAGGRFKYMNPAALRIFGAASFEEMNNRPVADHLRAPSTEEIRDNARRSTEESVPVSSRRETVIRMDGSSVSIEVSAVPFDLDGESGALVFFEDLTERDRAEEERRILEEQFRQAQKMESIGRLAGGVAHDFNNLLTIINGYSDILLGDITPKDRCYQPVLEIRNAGERAVGITRQLLAFSRKDVIEPKVLEPNQVIREVERMLRRLVGESTDIVVKLHPDAGLVLSDPGWLSQVLLNLAVNARDAMPEGGKLVIETAPEWIGEDYCRLHPAARTGKAVRLTVADTGCGMDEATLSHIFEPFFTTKPAGQGTGLGLSIVYGIVKNSGGWIDVESRENEGTSISIFLPAFEETGAPVQQAHVETRPEGNETVLLVEDDDTVRSFAEAALTSFGYKVIAASNGADALARATKDAMNIDLLLTDVVMPGMSGVQLAHRIVEMKPAIKVIFVSGYSREEASAPSAESVHRAYLAKPFTATSLAQTVRDVLDGKEL